MTRYYRDYTDVNLMNLLIEANTNLKEIGDLFHNRADMETLTKLQQHSLDYHCEGWELGEQIYDIYGDIGSILEEVELRFPEGV